MSDYRKGVGITLLGGACWGLSGTSSQYLCSAQGMDTRWITDLRLLGAGVILLLIAFMQDREKLHRIVHTPRALLHCIMFGVCGLMFTQFSYITSITKSNSGTATVLQYLSTIIVLLFVCITTKKMPVKREWLAILSCVAGTFLVTTHGSFTTLYISQEGLLWGIISAVAAALYIILPQDLMKKWGSITTVGIGMLSGGIAFFFLMRVWMVPISFNMQTAWMTVFIVLIGTAVAFTAFLKGTSMIGPARGNMLGCIEPLTATLTTAVFMHTAFSWIDLIGFALILATVFILAKDETKAPS
ncbi:MAG: DMT family transporter [Clostridia bacterium]|nr:DMT family transporter [Clostridia bacterium]